MKAKDVRDLLEIARLANDYPNLHDLRNSALEQLKGVTLDPVLKPTEENDDSPRAPHAPSVRRA
jgi:hypothetical protein